MLEILLKTLLSLLPFLKEWLFGGPKKRSHSATEKSLQTLKRILVVVVIVSGVSVTFLVDRLWVITKKYEQVLSQKPVTRAPMAPPVQPPATHFPPAVPCEMPAAAPTPAKKPHNDDYSKVVRQLKETQ